MCYTFVRIKWVMNVRKTILLLINGFGIERKDSAEVYSSSLMPNLDSLTKTELFGSLVTGAGDASVGYKLFSIPEFEEKQEDELDKIILQKTLGSVPIIKTIKNNLVLNNKLHLFYVINNKRKLGQIREIIKELNPLKDKNLFLHLIMTGTSVNDYDDIEKVINNISYEVPDYAKVGLIVGKNKLIDVDFVKTIEREYGEQWKEFNKKFDVLKRNIINPEDTECFMVNKGFAFNEGDIILYANYQDVEFKPIENFARNTKVNIYSLYYTNDNISYFLKRVDKGVDSLNNKLSKHNINLLYLTDKQRVDDANFYFGGMQKKKCSNIVFALNDPSHFATKANALSIIQNESFNGIIIDYDIGVFNRLPDVKSKLQSVDLTIKIISDICRENGYTFIISSLYGMHMTLSDGVLQKLVNFAGKVPCIYQSSEFLKKDYSLNSGTVYDLCLTFLTNICDEVKSNKLVHKMNAVEKLLSKK